VPRLILKLRQAANDADEIEATFDAVRAFSKQPSPHKPTDHAWISRRNMQTGRLDVVSVSQYIAGIRTSLTHDNVGDLLQINAMDIASGL
jgi:hypothetical protein